MDKKKLALVIKGRSTLNYVTPNVIHSLSNQFELLVIHPKSLESEVTARITSLSIRSRGFEEIRDSYDLAHFEELFSILRYKYIRRSKSFKYRHRRFGTYTTVIQNLIWFGFELLYHQDPIRLPSFAPSTLSENLRRFVIDSRNLVRKKISFLKYSFGRKGKQDFQKRLRLIRPEVELHRILEETLPDLVAFPSYSYDPLDYDLINSCKNLGIKSLSITENWDNLSSKSTPLVFADHITSWGEQTSEHAIRIQGYKKDAVHILGSPRIHQHFNEKYGGESHSNLGKAILFLGASHFSREQSILLTLSELLRADSFYGDVQIVYRPHPHHTQKIDLQRLNEANIHVNTDNLSDISSDKYLTNLISESLLVIGPYTTAVLEALLLGKPVIGLAYREPLSVYSPRRQRDYFVHLNELDLIGHLIEVRKLGNLKSALRTAFELSSHDPRELKSRSKDALNYFYRNPKNPFGEDLRNLVQYILSV